MPFPCQSSSRLKKQILNVYESRTEPSERLQYARRLCRNLQSRLAERARFELANPFGRSHAFQACLFSHSSISPMTFVVERTAKIIKSFEYSAAAAEILISAWSVNIRPRGSADGSGLGCRQVDPPHRRGGVYSVPRLSFST